MNGIFYEIIFYSFFTLTFFIIDMCVALISTPITLFARMSREYYPFRSVSIFECNTGENRVEARFEQNLDYERIIIPLLVCSYALYSAAHPRVEINEVYLITLIVWGTFEIPCFA